MSYSLTGYRADTIDRTEGPPTAARYIYDIVEKAIASVHDATWVAP